MDHDHFHAALVLGRIVPDHDRVAAVVSRLGDGSLHADTLFTTLSLSKVTRLARVALAGADLNSAARELLERIDKSEDAEDAWRKQSLPAMREVLVRAAEHDARVIKGLAVQAEYAEPDSRHVGDVDLQFPSWERALPTLRLLRAGGWAYDTTECCWLKWHPEAGMYGQLSLVLPNNAAPYARVDIHLGPYSVGNSGLMPLTGWRAGAPLGVPLPVPAPEVSVAIVAAHAVCDQMLSVKDVNDLHVLARDPELDWTSALELCRSVQAGPALLQLAALVRESYPEHALPLAEATTSAIGYGKLESRERAHVFGELARRDELARGAGEESANRMAESAERYFGADLAPRTSDEADTGPIPELRRRDLCWRLLPREVWDVLPAAATPDGGRDRESLATGLEFVRAGAGVAVTFGDDVFVPTVWGGVHPASVALARALAG